MLIVILIIIYSIFLSLGIKSTWSTALNVAFAGSSEILLPTILFMVIILLFSPIIGISNSASFLTIKFRKSKSDQNQ